ncbi:MAG: flagellar motor switch protein FliN/FliY [Halothiobacillaceae bacterium]|nr:MAG: flagellar motor switch protein FliN/FliY [Halothiobacillaceae bacterium]
MSDDDLLNGGDDWGAALAEQAAEEAKRNASAALPKANFEDLGEDTSKMGDDNANLEVILDIPVSISMEVGRTRISIRNLLQLNQGSIVELDRLAGEPLDVLVNGTLVAHGEVVVINERYGIRLTDVISSAERVKKLA